MFFLGVPSMGRRKSSKVRDGSPTSSAKPASSGSSRNAPTACISNKYLDNSHEVTSSSGHSSTVSPSRNQFTISKSNGCTPGVRPNAKEKSGSVSSVKPQARNSPLRAAATPFRLGTIGAIFSEIHGGIAPQIPPATVLQTISDVSANVAFPIVSKPLPQLAAASLRRAWGRRRPIAFSGKATAIDFHKYGAVVMDEYEVVDIKSCYENALLGMVIGQNFKFIWLSQQLHLKWGLVQVLKCRISGKVASFYSLRIATGETMYG